MSLGAPEMDGATVEVEQVLPAPPPVVWDYLVDPRLRGRWLGKGSIDLRPSGALDLVVRDEQGRPERVRGIVTACLPTQSLVLRWSTERGEEEEVTFQLRPVSEGTRLVILHRRLSHERGSKAVVLALAGATVALAGLLTAHLPQPRANPGPALVSGAVGGYDGPPSPPRRLGAGALPPFRRPWMAVVMGAVLLTAGVAGGLLAWHVLGPPHGTPTSAASCPLAPPGVFSQGPSTAGDSGWRVHANATCEPFTNGGKPVVFLLGSVACPYCDASSWAISRALANFSISTATTYVSSSPTDIYARTPGIDLAGFGENGTYLSWDPRVGTNPSAITVPSLGMPEASYDAEYNSGGGIPFLVIGGIAYHTGTLQDPQLFQGSNLSGLTAAQVEQNLSSGKGPIFDAVNSTQNYLEAYLAEADMLAGISLPPQIASNLVVMAIVASMP